jgi:uncharacterized damage-inducible protein DinB
LNDLIPVETDNTARVFFETALEFLRGDYLPKIERCLEQLDDEQIWWRANPESNSVGNLVLHLCGNARQWIVSGLGGQKDNRLRDAEFAQVEVIPGSELVALLRTTLTDVEVVISRLDPTTILEKRQIQGTEVDVLHAIFHVTEHFSMHTGQIILITKMLAGKDLRFYDFSNGIPVHDWC